MNTLDILLGMEVPKLPTKQVKIKRLSELAGKGSDVIFELRALPFSEVAAIREMKGDDFHVQVVLAGTVSPDLRSEQLLRHHGAATPAEWLKKMLLPGEIEDLSIQVEQLSGYRAATISEVKKK